MSMNPIPTATKRHGSQSVNIFRQIISTFSARVGCVLLAKSLLKHRSVPLRLEFTQRAIPFGTSKSSIPESSSNQANGGLCGF